MAPPMQPINQLNKLDQIHNSLHSYCDAIPDLDMMTQYDAILDPVVMSHQQKLFPQSVMSHEQ